ncbi:MAG TPA: sigma factor [Xanthobacteraceae bacterium]|nr:sigma factor [Xanthobacteraceae bacterium]
MRPDHLRKKIARDQARAEAAPDRLAQFRADLAAAYPTLLPYAIKLTRNRERAADLVQDTCAKALEFEGAYRPGTNFGGWLATIMLHRFCNDQRKRKREQEDPEDALASTLQSPDYDRDAALDAAEALRLMLDLPFKFIDPILRLAQGEDYEAIAASWPRRPIGTVKSRVHRGRHMLRSLLVAAGHEVPA